GLVARTAEIAAQRDTAAVAVTFWPPPEAVLRPAAAPPLLSTLAERLALLAACVGLHAAVVMPFDEALSRLSPQAFLDRLGAFCQPVVLVEGPDFAVGHKRAGDLNFLRDAG